MLLIELYFAVGEGEEGEISSATNVATRMVFCAALTQDDVAGHYCLTAKFLHAESLAVAVATISGSTLSFFVCHCYVLSKGLFGVDRLDFYYGDLLAVSFSAFIALATLLLEDDNFFVLLVLQNLGLY